MTGQQALRISCHHCPNTKILCVCAYYHAWLLLFRYWGSNLGPHACMANTTDGANPLGFWCVILRFAMKQFQVSHILIFILGTGAFKCGFEVGDQCIHIFLGIHSCIHHLQMYLKIRGMLGCERIEPWSFSLALFSALGPTFQWQKDKL